ncbi:MAG: DUF1080 domain-containing protein [Planctomycetota bacterium]|jgi:hypothetical protein
MRSFFRFATLVACLPLAATAGWSVVGFAEDVVRHENPNGLPAPSGDGWQPLFNGTDLTGWQQRNGWAVYRVADSTILGTTSKHSPNSFLCTSQDYDNFELKFQVKVDDALNSGVQIRSKSIPERDSGRVHGPQVEIESTGGTAGYVYGEATGRNWISPSQPPHRYFKPGEWNQYHIRAQGNRIQTWINGHLIEDMTDSLSHSSGFIGLQVHSVGADQGPFQVRWKDIAIRPLKP